MSKSIHKKAPFFIISLLSVSVTTTALSENVPLQSCQFYAPATMTLPHGTVAVGDNVNISMTFDVSTVPFGITDTNGSGSGFAAYQVTNGIVTVEHPTEGSLNGNLQIIQLSNTGSAIDGNAFDYMQFWFVDGWQGIFGGITPPSTVLTSNGYANGFRGINFADNTGPVLTDLDLPLEVGVWNAFQVANTKTRSLRIPKLSPNGNNPGAHYADIGNFVGGCVPVIELSCNELEPTIIGTEGHDHIIGTEGPDVIMSLGGNDTIESLGGDDTICAGDGNDTVLAGAGADWVSGDKGNDTLAGNNGTDQLFGRSGNDTLGGGKQDDTLNGNNGNDTCFGGNGADASTNCEENNFVEIIE